MTQECVLDTQPWHNGEPLYQPYEKLFRDVWCIGPHEYKRLWLMCNTPEQFEIEVKKSVEALQKYGLATEI